MRKYLLAGSLSTLLILSACGNEESEAEESTDENEEVATENEESEQGTEESEQGTRSNPYQLGDTAEIDVSDTVDGEEVHGTANITIDDVKRGDDAMAEINYEGRGNEHGQYEEDEDLERMVFNMDFELVDFEDDDTPYESRARVLTYNENGEELPDDTIPNIQDDFDRTELYQGGTQSGQVNQVAPKEGPFMIKIVNFLNDDVFFEVE